MTTPQLSIIVPVFNSEDCLEELHRQVSLSVDFVRFELIFVNDQSLDRSWQKIVEIARQDPRVHGITLKKNSGQDNAIMAGLSTAQGDYVAVMDDDLQHRPSDIRILYQTMLNENADVCYGLFEKKEQSMWKNVGSGVNDFFARVFLKKPRELYLSPFKIMHKSLVAEILTYKGPFPYIDGIILSVTNKIAQCPLKHERRFVGRSNYNLVRSISVFLKHVTGYSLYPLRLASIVGVFASSLSFLLGALYTFDYLTTERRVEGWITLVLLMVFFNGLILMCLGMIGEYVGRIYLTVTARRQYSIDKVVNFASPDLSANKDQRAEE